MANNEKKVLVIGNNNEFLVRSVVNDLVWRDFNVSETGPSVTEVSKADPAIRLYIMIINNFSEVVELLVYLKEVTFDKKLYVCAVCNHNDTPEIAKHMAVEEFAAFFERPVNIKEVGTAMEELYEKSCTEKRKKAILIIDDDPTYLRKTQQLLKDSYKIYMANSAASALMVLSKHTVDLILLDYDMPIIDGPTAYEMIKAEPKVGDTPIMFLTGKSDRESIATAINLKPVHYILKSLPAKELITTISHFFVNQSS
ncbi:MAG TPA: hypothetical protein DCL38_04975 [Lachnospiraceae bacterium]|nr:hypothetical protein [Lachnospiraceae bacterium]